MNRIEQAITLLEAERQYIDRALEILRALPALTAKNGDKPHVRRGRHPGGMDAAERQRVSVRIKAYWAKRRQERAAGGGA